MIFWPPEHTVRGQSEGGLGLAGPKPTAITEHTVRGRRRSEESGSASSERSRSVKLRRGTQVAEGAGLLIL